MLELATYSRNTDEVTGEILLQSFKVIDIITFLVALAHENIIFLRSSLPYFSRTLEEATYNQEVLYVLYIPTPSGDLH